MGKGLEAGIILELLYYISASLIPLALPLAILLSSIITFGNLAEKNELTALKSSGLSLYRIMRPLTAVIIGIAIGTFYFSNYVIPVANMKWHSIIYDIQETKLANFLKPGSYTDDIDGFSIKIKSGSGSEFEDIIIHDHRESSIIKTITAKSGESYKSSKGDFLFFKLKDGQSFEEISSRDQTSGSVSDKFGFHPSRKTTFKTATYKMSLTGFEVAKSDDDLFKNKHEMLNVFQLNETIDSLRADYADVATSFAKNVKTDHIYFQDDKEKRKVNHKLSQQVKTIKKENDTLKSNRVKVLDTLQNKTIEIAALSNSEKLLSIRQALVLLRSKHNNLEGQVNFEASREADVKKYQIEFHRKFSLSFTIIILFFIGAPLGAIVKKGGFGLPVVIAALLFMIYFVLISIGDSMAQENIVSPELGMWGPSIILFPFAIILMRAAANDSKVFDLEIWKKLLKRKKVA